MKCPGSGADPSCHGQPGPLNASIYERAGFTALMPDPGSPVGGMTRWMSNATEKPYGLTGYDLQIIREFPSMAEVLAYKDHPQILAWYLSEEPIGSQPNMTTVFAAFADQAAAIRKVDTVHPVFALLAYSPPNIYHQPADFDHWWKMFADTSDVNSMDNYPMTWANAKGLATDPTNADGAATNLGLGEMIDVAVSNSNESKPVWMCLQAMENWLSGIFTWRMPTPRVRISIGLPSHSEHWC